MCTFIILEIEMCSCGALERSSKNCIIVLVVSLVRVRMLASDDCDASFLEVRAGMDLRFLR
jgi:hypothetical protein